MAGSPRDELVTVTDFSPGLNLVGSPVTFRPGETDLADNVWLGTAGDVYARPGLRAVLHRGRAAGRFGVTSEGAEFAAEMRQFRVFTVNGRVGTVGEWVRPEIRRDGGVLYRPAVAIAVDSASERVPSDPSLLTWQRDQTLSWVPAEHETGIRPDFAFAESVGVWAWGNGRCVYFRPGAHQSRCYEMAPLSDKSDAGWNSDYAKPAVPVQAFYDTLGKPVLGDAPDSELSVRFPLASRVLNVNAGSARWMFAAHANRVRWSHPFTVSRGLLHGPFDWAANDFTDLAVDDSVTAMAHWRDSVLVFTSGAVFGLYGSPPDDVNVVVHSRTVGCVSPNAVALSPEGVWFYSHPEGLYVWDGTAAVQVSERLGDVASLMTAGAAGDVSVGYRNRRVWLSLPGAGTFVLDLRTNGWVRHDYEAACFVAYDVGERSGSLLACARRSGAIRQPAEVSQQPGGDDLLLAGRSALNVDPVSMPVDAALRVGPLRADVPDMRAKWRSIDVSSDCADLRVAVEADGRMFRESVLPAPVRGLRFLRSEVRAWRLGLLLRWRGAGCVVALIGRYWPGRREGAA